MKENFYFDNAATTWPKPEPVYRFMDEFFRSHGVNPGRAGHTLAVEAEGMIVQTRRLLAGFFGFGGDPNRVVFTQNATDSLNAALFGLIEPGDHLVITRLEHNSVLRPANHMERDRGVSVTRVGADGCGYIDPEDIRKAIGPKTRAVVVNHGSNVLGSVQDIAAIGRIVAETDAAFIVDTCQTAGVIAIDMDRWGIDILAFTGHKGLFGPMGIGGMIVREGVALRPARVGGTGVDSVSPFQPDAYPYHLEAGTVSLPGIAGLNAAQAWFAALGRERLGAAGADSSHGAACRAALDHIAARERGHVERLHSAFEAMDNVIVYGPRAGQPRVATLIMNVEGIAADQLGAMMDGDHCVCVRAGLHCAPLAHQDVGTMGHNGAVRFSPGYFTDDEDLEVAIAAVMDVAEFAARRRVATSR
jgi:cysteine desulfurase family protein